MKKLLLLTVALCAAQIPAFAVALMFGDDYWATVNDPGNAAHTGTPAYGAVDYAFQIGKTEITNQQYVEFLNAVAASDPYGLYNESMGTATRGGIMRSGIEGSYTYSVKITTWDYSDRPVNYVSVYDAIRYVNWLNNGATTGADTETGAYLLLGGSATPTNAADIVRQEGATYYLPTLDEWFKAAYYKGGGADAGYWLYATSSDTAPTAGPPTSAANSANYDNKVGNPDVTPVGSYTNSASPYGTFDQNGGVFEWTDYHAAGNPNFGQLGGSWGSSAAALASNRLASFDPGATESASVGFRIIAVIPEPSAYVLIVAGVGCLILLGGRRTA